MEESKHWYEEQTSYQLTNVPCDRVLSADEVHNPPLLLFVI